MEYKMYKKDRGQWVEVASFDDYSKARYYARRMHFEQVDNPNQYNNYFYNGDTWHKDYCVLMEALTDEQIDEINSGEDYTDSHGVAVCRHCGNLIGINNTNQDYINVDGNYYCDSQCAYNDDCFYCENCEEWYDSSTTSYTTANNRTICEYCRDDHYFTCERCGELFHEDDCYTYDDGYYCEDCYNEIYEDEDDSIIKSYHSSSRPSLKIHTTEEDSPQDATMGTEVETECMGSSDRDEVASAINEIVNSKEDLFMFEEDGSLSDEGYETISQPFTMRWFKKNQELFQKMFSTMIHMGCRSHDTDSCGFHVHFGRHFFGNQEQECIDRLLYLFEKYKEQLEVFSRRKRFNWCQFPSVVTHNPCEWTKLDEVKKLNKWDFRGHHSAINLENANTIEIRIFRGTLNFNTYCATLEFVNNLMTYVRDKSDKEVEEGNFRDILEYLPTEHLMQYCLDRNII